MHVSARSVQVVKGKHPQLLMIRTTLYDLIAAISAEVQADEDDLITATTVHLLEARRVTYLSNFKYRRLAVQPRWTLRHRQRKAAIPRLRSRS
jgi:hypothetical protein